MRTRCAPLHDPLAEVIDRLWRIGGANGRYHAQWLWWLRGLLDRLVGCTGLRRGRRHPTELRPGDALDFSRVLVANRERGRLLLYAEMRLPGEAWLAFELERDGDGPPVLRQKATFRPHGLAGRAYWLLVTPLHALVFGGLRRGLVDGRGRAGWADALARVAGSGTEPDAGARRTTQTQPACFAISWSFQTFWT
ncbi:MAG: DUF2867 domain-containing protein [Trueperaceae bacterium]